MFPGLRAVLNTRAPLAQPPRRPWRSPVPALPPPSPHPAAEAVARRRAPAIRPAPQFGHVGFETPLYREPAFGPTSLKPLFVSWSPPPLAARGERHERKMHARGPGRRPPRAVAGARGTAPACTIERSRATVNAIQSCSRRGRPSFPCRAARARALGGRDQAARGLRAEVPRIAPRVRPRPEAGPSARGPCFRGAGARMLPASPKATKANTHARTNTSTATVIAPLDAGAPAAAPLRRAPSHPPSRAARRDPCACGRPQRRNGRALAAAAPGGGLIGPSRCLSVRAPECDPDYRTPPPPPPRSELLVAVDYPSPKAPESLCRLPERHSSGPPRCRRARVVMRREAGRPQGSFSHLEELHLGGARVPRAAAPLAQS